MPRLLENISAAHRPPRQARPGTPPGRGAPPGGSGQPPFEPTPEQRGEVRKYVACGFTTESISIIMSIPTATLERHFQFELTNGKLLVDARILGGIVEQAMMGDKTMAIFWAKARAGWRDVGREDGATNTGTVFSISIGGPGSNGDSAHEIKVTSIPRTLEHEPDDEP